MSQVDRNGSAATVTVAGDIVASMAREFRHELKSLVEEGTKDLVIDMTKVEMVDSVGLGVLIATHNSLAKTGGALKITNVSSDIRNLFKTMRLDQHLVIKEARAV